MAGCGKHNKSLSNASRNLHRLIKVKGKTLNIDVTPVSTVVKARAYARRKKLEVRPWPVLRLRTWMEATLGHTHYRGFFLLGGHKLESLCEAEQIFERFWARHQWIDPSIRPSQPKRTIPLYIHGDEGRGQCKKPVLVISFQPVISWAGENTVNSEKYLWVDHYMNLWCFICCQLMYITHICYISPKI